MRFVHESPRTPRSRRLAIAIALLALVLSGCVRGRVYREAKVQIGTVVTLSAYTTDKSLAYEAFKAAFAEVERVGALMGSAADSDVSRINDAPAGRPVEISPESAALIARALEISRLSDGAFDITFAPLGKIWDYKRDPFVVPTENEIRSARENVGYQYLALSGTAVTKSRDGVRIGLGAIAKGYIVGRCTAVMRENGIENGIVDAGGDIQVFGTKGGKKWIAGVRHPRMEDALLMQLSLDDGESCVTSGDYERFAVTPEGKRYHHIIDPRTGYPTETFTSVTVITDDPELADAYATAVFVMGLERTKEFLRDVPSCEVILVDSDLRCFASKSLRSRITPIEPALEITWM